MQNPPSPDIPFYDVLIVGAGLSGIGTAYWLQNRCPDKSYVIFEARAALGGTWDLFRYPGIRSDSDMFTFGYTFRPWKDPKPLADGPSIRQYIEETARENGIDQHIRFGHRVSAVAWSSADACWTVEARRLTDGARVQARARFLYLCSGYYNYEEAYRPDFEGEQRFKGTVVLPQFWPETLDYAGKRIVVVGSGATAVTLVPTLAQTAAHVTMLQRSPTYIMTLPNKDPFYERAQKWLSPAAAYRLTRWKNLVLSVVLYRLTRMFPKRTKTLIVRAAGQQLGSEQLAETHFSPRYNPWDQRLCVVPDGDLFRAVRSGKASVVTDEIERFTETGLRLKSGQALEADIVVLATGLKIKLLGGARVTVDGQVVDPHDLMAYKGMMLSDIPNCAIAFGYTNASWTLKTDLTAGYVTRLLRYMDRHGYAIVTPRRQPGVQPEPFLSFDSGYIKRAEHLLPRQGSRRPWRVYQNYFMDMLTIRFGRIADGVLHFGPKP